LARGKQPPRLSLFSLKVSFLDSVTDGVLVHLALSPFFAFGLLSWEHLIFNNIIDLPSLTPLNEKCTELDDDITVFSRAAV